MEKLSKVESVVTILNCTLECLFDNKTIEEEYSGDIVSNYGFGYGQEIDTEFEEMVDGETFETETYYNKLFVEKVSPLEVLGELGWSYATTKEGAVKRYNKMVRNSKFIQDLLKNGH